jgi:hypothetical protein
VQKPGAGAEVITGAAVHRSSCAKENFDDSIKKNKKAVNRILFRGRMNIFIVDLLAFQ